MVARSVMLFLAHSEATAVAASAEARDSQTVMETTATRMRPRDLR
jgi:hypothetical protein